MILSDKRKAKALISLRRCPCWSALLLFAYPEDMFSLVKGPNFICIKAFLLMHVYIISTIGVLSYILLCVGSEGSDISAISTKYSKLVYILF